MGLGVWGKNSGWVITNVSSMGMGGSVPFLEVGAQFDGINVVMLQRSTGKTAMFQGSGLGASVGAGISPFSFGGSGPANNTYSNAIYTWDESDIKPIDLTGALYIWGANAEFAGNVSTGQVWYFRGPNYNFNPWGSVAASWVGGDGATTELLAGNFNGTRYKLELVRES